MRTIGFAETGYESIVTEKILELRVLCVVFGFLVHVE